MRKSKRRARTRKSRKDSRTIPIWGDPERGGGEDHGKYYRCWNCQSICNIERDARPKSHGHGGIPASEVTIPELPVPCSTESPGSFYIIIGGAGPQRSHVLYNRQSKQAKSYHRVDAPGCWFCGSPNWRGDA